MKSTLHLVCGMAGSGKTTLAKKLEAALPVVRFCPDEWIMKLLADPADSKENGRLRDIVESIQWETAQHLLSLGTSVVLENGFWGRNERESYRTTAKQLDSRVVIHFLDPTEEELWQRLEKRNANLPEGTFPVRREAIAEWMTWFQKPDGAELAMYDKLTNLEKGALLNAEELRPSHEYGPL
jgi:hypothetical protein